MSTEMTRRVGAAILLAELEWTPKASVSKEQAMALAAIEALRVPTERMVDSGLDANPRGRTISDRDLPTIYTAMIDAALT